MSSELTSNSEQSVTCDVVGWAACRVSAAEVPGIRKSPGHLGDEPLKNGLLRHVDEQTVVGVAAVLQAIRDSGLDPTGFERWSVLAAPRFLGRAKFEASFPQYRDEGAWGVSPHLVPGHSLHSPSGTISQVLHAHGPNLGIGGTPGGEREAFLTAATWLEMGQTDGIWVVLTSRDPVDSGTIAVSEPGDYRALAVALVAAQPLVLGPRLRISPAVLQLETSDPAEAFHTEWSDWFGPMTGPGLLDGKLWRADLSHDLNPGRRSERPSRIREST